MRIAVFVSGNGSNLQVMLDDAIVGSHIRLVVCNVVGAKAIKRAQDSEVEVCVISHSDYNSRQSFEEEVIRHLRIHRIEFVILAGFMRVLSPYFIEQYRQRIINIHPSLLPKHKGLNTHSKVLECGDKEHGVTVHYVAEGLDAGAILGQKRFKVVSSDSVASLKNKAHTVEHKLYPQIVKELLSNSY